MNIKYKLRYALAIIGLSVGISFTTSSSSFAQSQPQSTITSTAPAAGVFYDPYDDTTTTCVTLSTAEVPTPNCPDDTADGDPDYYWDFGSDLDATDNEDGTYGPNGVAATPDTATIVDDVAATYDVTVYCTQDFTPSDGSADYTNQTQTSAQ